MIPMSHYKHFTTKEREKILFFLAQEKTISFIAKELQRDKSSVSREIKLILKAFTRHHTHKSNMKFADANVVENHCY